MKLNFQFRRSNFVSISFTTATANFLLGSIFHCDAICFVTRDTLKRIPENQANKMFQRAQKTELDFGESFTG